MSNVGDLGRRVRERRRQLGLSADEVARRAHMDPSYLAMLESSSGQPTVAALLRLSAALETTVVALSGAGAMVAPGRSSPSARADLRPLAEEECMALVSGGGVGRIVFNEDRGPMALPVNYSILGRDVLFRTAARGPVTSAIAAGTVSFEVDNIDDALSEGWSVVLTGDAHVVTDPEELAAAQGLNVHPWAGELRNTYVRLIPTVVTGRHIRRS